MDRDKFLLVYIWLGRVGFMSVVVTVLVDNMTFKEMPIFAENGLSLLIEVESEGSISRILLDTGYTGDALLRNCSELNVDLSSLDAIVITHNHYDHSGGLLKVLSRIDKPIPVIAHPELFYPKYAILPSLGLKKLTYTGPPFSRRMVEDRGGLLILSRNPVRVAENVMTTGEIARVFEFEQVRGFYTVRDGEFREDELLDDMGLIVKLSDESIAVFTGCAHSGVINTVNHALKLTGAKRVSAIIGGFHLIDATEERIEKTLNELRRLNPDIIAPLHCTGLKATMKIAENLPEKFQEIHCGDKIKI